MFISNAISQKSFDIFQGKTKECKRRAMPALMEMAGATILISIGIIGLLSHHGVSTNPFHLGITGSAISTTIGGVMVIDLAFFCIAGVKAYRRKKTVHEEIDEKRTTPKDSLKSFVTLEPKHTLRNTKITHIQQLLNSKLNGDVERKETLTTLGEEALNACEDYSKAKAEKNSEDAIQALRKLDEIIQKLTNLK